MIPINTLKCIISCQIWDSGKCHQRRVTTSHSETLPPQLGKIISRPVGQWVLKTIKGVEIEFMETPRQNIRPFQHKQSETDSNALQKEIASMLNKGAIIKLSEREAQNGKIGPVIN